MNAGKLLVIALFCASAGLGCSGDDPERDRRGGEAGEAGDDSGGTSGSGGVGAGSGGTGTAGALSGSGGASAGSAGSAGSGAGSGGGGTSASGGTAGSATAGAGSGGIPDPLPAADDPSRISELRDCALAQAGACVVADPRTKEEACQRWDDDWTKRAPSGYALPDDECLPAELEVEAEADAIRRINLYRWFSNQPPLALNDEWSLHAADCAVIQAHLDDVDHYPPATSACYSERGGVASADSLLAIGSYTPADSIDDLIWDWGERNFHVLGHRWWLLHPGLREVGLGFSVPNEGRRGTCVRTNGGTPLDHPPDLTGVVPYPGYGVTPFELISRESHAKPVPDALEWSITFPDNVDVQSATVRVFRDTGGRYEPFAVTAGPYIRDFNGLWVQPSVDPAPPGEYLVMVAGTVLGEFGYRARIERCTGEGAPAACEPAEQDCASDSDGCYGNGVGYCTRAGMLEPGEECLGNQPFECAAGSACVENRQVRDGFECAAYCDPNSSSSPASCNEVCPAGYIYTEDPETGGRIGAHCTPGVGSPCDPLNPECPSGQACYGWEPARCFLPGMLTEGQTCEYANDCVPGLLCIGVQGGTRRCDRYCDLATTTEADSCETLCPGSYFEFDGFGACYTP